MNASPKFEILEHTADIGIRAWGGTLAELFENAALAVESVAVELEHVEPRIAYPIAAAGEDPESLLVNWLNEVVYYVDGRRVAMSRFHIDSLTETHVAGRGWGEPRDPERHPPRIVVKAATYHQLRIFHENDRWIAEVYLDI